MENEMNMELAGLVNGVSGYTFGNEAGWHYCHTCGKVWSETDVCNRCGALLRTKQEVVNNWINV